MRRIDKNDNKEIAKRRIDTLFKEAAENRAYASRYVEMARKLSTRYKVKILSHHRRKFCRQCNSFLDSGNSTRRIREGKLIVNCRTCGHISRFVYKK